MNLREISDATNISIRYLEALEENRFDILPAPVFVRGFLRQYARYVGLDADEVVNSYLSVHGASTEGETAAAPLHRQGGDWVSGLVLGLAGLLVLAGVAALALYVERSGERQEPPPPMASPRVTEPPPIALRGSTAETPAVPLLVTLEFLGDCWVEATIDDERRLSQLHLQGESLRLEAQQRVLLTLGDPAAVRAEVNGEPYTLAGYPVGQAVRDLVIELPDPAPGPAAE